MRLASLASLATVLGLTATAAAADWTYDPASLPAGQARATGSGAETILVECGNGGYPAVILDGPRPVGGPEESYVLRVDGYPERLIFADCGPGGCMLEFDTAGDVRSFISELRSGNALQIGFYRNGLGGAIPLGGSSAAIGSVFAAGCEMP